MLPIHLALVSMVSGIELSELLNVSAAIQKQVARDFGPIWAVDATVDPFATLDSVPVDYWRILIVDTFPKGGQHRDRNHQPFALVAAGSSWSLVASHEALEMLADPFGDRTVAGESPDPTQGRVEFLVEVCDPCQSDDCAYTVNGVLVSDFYTPNYFDPIAAQGVRYSFTGALTGPREVQSGGYLTWREPTSGNWFQQHVDGSQSTITSLGPIAPGANSLRATIDAGTAPDTRRLSALRPDRPAMQRALRLRETTGRANAARAEELRTQLNRK